MNSRVLTNYIFGAIFLFQFLNGSVFAQSASTDENYIQEIRVKSAGHKTVSSLLGLPVDSANRTVRYIDGLGRPLQTVTWQGSPSKKDLIQMTEYDALGRESRKYLPYAVQSGADAAFKADASTSQLAFYGAGALGASVKENPYPFSRTVFEASPLNRVLEQGAPGAAWQPMPNSTAGHTTKTDYGTNINDEVKLWKINSSGDGAEASVYLPGRLNKTISKDENWISGKGGAVEEFKDFEGRVVLKRVWESESVALSTYYVYDDLNNLRYVLPPAVSVISFTEGDAVFLNYIYGYHYDGRNRVIEKKIPGKGWEHLVYNRLDQVVLSQDSKQFALGKWLFMKYDALGRLVMTGEVDSRKLRAVWQADIDAQAVLYERRDDSDLSHAGTGYTNNILPNADISSCHTINYYDDYLFLGNTMGMPNGTNEVAGNKTKGLLTGTKVNTLGTTDFFLSVSYYDVFGRAVRIKAHNNVKGTDETLNNYNFANELIGSTRVHNSVIASVGKTLTIANRYLYDHMSRKTGTEEKIDGGGWVRLNKLEYNEIGQLKKKLLHSTDDGASFLQQTGFAYNERGWLKNSSSNEFNIQLDYQDGIVPQYNGNISNQRWGSVLDNVFTYGYDKLNRLTSGTSTGILMNETLSYDAMGNIDSLIRYDGTVTKKGNYHYTGNRLDNITGGSLATGSYVYDANGNVITDGRTGISLGYNLLNLPESAVRTTGIPVHIAYTYSAIGQKLKKVSGTAVTDYVAGIQYENGKIDFIQTEEGLARNNDGIYTYEYNLTDHLGNVRFTFNKHPVTGNLQKLQEDNYYAFGLRRVASAGTNKYLYNGKELQEEMGQYDYGARFYDPVIGRWNVVDKLAEHPNQIDKSPYAYGWNNPVNLTDPDGNCPVCPIIWWAAESIATRYIVGAVVAGTATAIVMNGVNNYSRNRDYSVQDNTSVYKPKLQQITKKEGEPETKNEKLRGTAKLGQEAHRQEQKKLKEEGAEIEVPMELEDGTKVRKDAVRPDGTVIIIKPNTPSGRKSAEKREELMKKNNHKPEVKLYDPNNPAYLPGSPTYIGPKKKD